MFKSFPVRIYFAAVVLRLIPVFLASDLGIGLDDMFQYDMLARSLAQGHGYRWYAEVDLKQLASYVDFDLFSIRDYDPLLGVPTSFRAPLYPTFLSVVYFLAGTGSSRFFAARIAQAIFLGAPLAPLTYFVAKRLFALPLEEGIMREEFVAHTSAWIVAAYPMLLIYPLGLGTENPFFVLLMISFLFLLKVVERQTTFNFVFSGMLLGLAALTRSVIIAFSLFAILWVWFSLGHKRGAVLLAIAFGLTVGPWIIRNSLLHGKLTGIETSMGYNLYLGYHPQGNGSFVFGPSLDLLPILDDAERDRIGTEMAIGFIRAEPGRFVPVAVNRLGFIFGLEKRVSMYFYGNNLIGYVPFPLLLIISAILLLPFVVVSTSAALGLSLLLWRPEHILLGLLFLGYIAPHVFILAEDRFHLALVPFIAILAAQFWANRFSAIWARWKESRSGQILVLLSIFCFLLLITNWGVELARDWDRITQLLGPAGNQSYFPY